ncbi:MAG TPA: exodeoxyribonuclease VII large subunit [Firmicutes bacterium]|nr:exodeoxyribonuclease VII large subunit [Candidatus Fermentithermobacillaceae bacterium]
MLLAENAISVSQLNAYVRETLWKDEFLRQVLVRGEIANLRNYQGHLYFTLKDEKASVRAVMWRSDTSRLTFVPKDGDQVLVAGSVSVFERDGIYQVYATYMEPSGLGALYAALEKLKAKLEAEGLFAPERKRPLPAFPRKIGLVTSVRGAAIKDIVTCGRRRYPGVSFVVVDTKVQGEGAPQDIAAGLRILDAMPDVDVIIVGRGGGSQEDLFVFNDEIVARAIYACKTPVVSAVGHERDITIADLVADARAATPTQAAELVVPDAYQLKAGIRKLTESLRNQMLTLIGGSRQTLSLLRSRPALTRPDWFLVSSRETLVRLQDDLQDSVTTLLERHRHLLSNAASKLDALSPLRILGRGYSLARLEPGKEVVTDYRQAPKGARITVTLKEGQLACLVEESGPREEDSGDEQ